MKHLSPELVNISQLIKTCSKSTIQTEQGVNYVQRSQLKKIRTSVNVVLLSLLALNISHTLFYYFNF